jgi:hypothetical protein
MIFRRILLWLCATVGVLAVSAVAGVLLLWPQSKPVHASEEVPEMTAAPLIARQIRYRAPAAKKVMLGWGVNGWHAVPAVLRSPGTVMRQGVMNVPMTRQGEYFSATIRVPSGTIIDYGFLSNYTVGDAEVEVWETDKNDDYHFVAAVPGALDIEARLIDGQEPVTAETRFHAIDLRYESDSADDVTVVWGVNGWHLLPESIRPARTTVRNSVMNTPMTRNGRKFAVRILVPTLSRFHYGFVASSRRTDPPTAEWEGDWQLIATSNQVVDVRSKLTLKPRS